MDLVIAADDPRADDVRTLITRHLAFSYTVTPPDHVFALDIGALVGPAGQIEFFSARRDGRLLGMGALKRLDDAHAEIKSMHTAEAARGQGVGEAVVRHLLAVAVERGYRRVSLETGSMEAYAPARALYRKLGFEPCEPFGDYAASPHSTHMTMETAPPR
ncbi:MAG TPA: GNAT family N-acetyltransferase [Actinocrinis sp.]|jgi:putative acetyltransferase